MFPVLFQVGPVEVYAFGVMIAGAALLCSFLMAREGRALGIPSQEIYDIVFWGAFGGIVGSRLFYILLNLPVFLSDPSEIFMLTRGGLAWQGGLIFGALAVLIVIRCQKRSVLFMADFIAPYLALGHAVGRLGCFLNGCCYGTAASWGIYFPVHQARLHPTQLYEAAALLVMFFILMRLRRVWAKIAGGVFSAYLMAAALIRFIVEFFRGDHETLLLGLSVFQHVSIFFFMAGAVFFFVMRRKNG